LNDSAPPNPVRRQHGGDGVFGLQQRAGQPAHVRDGDGAVGAGQILRRVEPLERQRLGPAPGQAADAVVFEGELRQFLPLGGLDQFRGQAVMRGVGEHPAQGGEHRRRVIPFGEGGVAQPVADVRFGLVGELRR
jgi:hypothetical protein